MSNATIACPLCGKQCKPLGLSSHIRIVHTEYGKELVKKANNGRRGKSSWNQGLTSETDDRIKQASVKISQSLQGVSRPHTEETRKKISERMKVVGGGYRRGSGIGKSGWYNEIWCDSSWELAFVLWCEIHRKPIVRNTKSYVYEVNGKQHKYYPDFIVDGEIVEIKGRRVVDEVISAKMAACPQARLLLEADMKPILAEVIEKYGNDFCKLYGG